MTQQKKYLAIAGGALTIFVVGWFALSHVATNRAEEQIVAALDNHGLRDKVQWENLSASPFGTVRIKNLTVQITPKGEVTRIGQVVLSNFLDEAERKSADVQLTDIVDANGHSPLGKAGFMAAAGRTDLPPLALHLKWDMRLGDNEGQFDMVVNQPEAFRGNLNLQLEQIASLGQLPNGLPTDRKGPQGLGYLASRGGFGLGSIFGLMGTLGEIKLRTLHADIEDDGYVKRSIALYKRYTVNVTPDGGRLASQRDAGFDQQIRASLNTCQKQPPELLKGLPDRDDACASVMDFISGDSDSLTIDLEPRQPISLSSLVQMGMTNPARLLPLLNPEIGS